ncbi:MAG: S8 family serine peptidase [Bacteroidia bacterium]|nr:S8 family serine peptidase [Bacteroidia bacterium]
MKKQTKFLVLALLFSIASTFVNASSISPRKGIVRVKLQPQVALQVGNSPRIQSVGVLQTGIVPLDRASSEVKARSIKRVFPYAPKFERQMAKFGLDRWYEIEFDESVAPQTAARIYSNTVGVESATAKVPMQLYENGSYRIVPSATAKASTTMPFNDPLLPKQWHYNNDGSIAGCKAGADVNLFKAWEVETGKSDVLVAIIDGGVDYTHEDLKDNMFVNLAELNGTPGVDDDGNGYIDDVYGYNFCTMSGEIYPHSHGTHVAGTVAAVNNNGIGVSGVAGGDGTPGSGVRMISCQTFDSRSGTAEGDFAAAIVYAANMGASIAQCSWGWGAPDYVEPDVLDAIDYFVENANSTRLSGGVMFFASGNNGETGNYFPGCYEKVVCVGSMTSDYTVASYSNFGDWVDVMAPGGLLDYGEQGGVLSTLPDNSYGFNEGTSMATPHVSGIAALVLSKYGKSSMLNETLRQQIITSVNDIYAHNPGTEGLHGSGYVDAAKALQMGDGTAPEAVSSFVALPAQDNITLEWTIPASSDNNVNHHIVYYSTEPFDASSDLTSLHRAVAETKFLSSGDSYSYTLKGLKSLTTYYIAIQAVNRWGDASALSPVVEATTNAGPKMTLSATSLVLNVTPSAPKDSISLQIGNDDDGLLRWDGFARTKSSTISSYSKNPQPGLIVPHSGKIAAVPYEATEVVSTADYYRFDYPIEFTYSKEFWASIGEDDNNILGNSQAQYFYVDADDYPDGFNLTSVKVCSVYGQELTIQIYVGNNIAKANLVEEIVPAYYYNGMVCDLQEQRYIAPGEGFWVVAHFPKQNDKYTLGLSVGINEQASQYSFMSTDMGKTWLKIKDALKGSPYENITNPTWNISAISKNPDWSSLLVLSPKSGQVSKGQTQELTISNDGQPLCNGTYKFNLRFNTNESDGNNLVVATTLNVTDQAPKMATAKMVNFGDLLVGESKTLTIEVLNEGYGVFGSYGALSGSNISCSSEHFVVPTYIAGGFPARSKATFEVKYAPKSAGSHTGTITFKHKDGTKFKVTVRGIATDPAKISVDPSEINVGDINIDESTKTTVNFTITNEGNYPLEFVFPRFSDKSIDGGNTSSHKFGYVCLNNIEENNSFTYQPAGNLIGAVNIASSFNDDVYYSKPISLGFEFPFYGKKYDRAYITSFGGIAFEENVDPYRDPLDEESTELIGIPYISAYGKQLAMGPKSRVEYAKQDGNFIVNFSNVMAAVYEQVYTPISFRIVLSSNGDITLYYDDYTASDLFQGGSTLFCGIHDADGTDNLVLTSTNIADYWGIGNSPNGYLYTLFTSGSAVRFVAPKAEFVTSISPAYGVVNPGDSEDITAQIEANVNLVAGETYNRIAIVSNDPNQNTTFIQFNANVVGASLAGNAELESNLIDFGNVFRTSISQLPIVVKNTGRNAVTVTSVTTQNGKVQVDFSEPISIDPGRSKDIIVTLPTTDEADIADVVVIETSAGQLTAQVKGHIIGVPTIDLNFTEINESLVSGTPLVKSLTIENNGNEPLVYSLQPCKMLSYTDEVDANSKVSYLYKASVDNSDVTFDWVDIVTDGRGEQNNFSYYNVHDFVAVDLPFEFSFYGKKYTKMYIYNTGFISFTERADQKIWPEPPAEFPGGTIYTNLIAPYWGLHSMDQSKTAGTFHYETEDEAIVSFMEYGNSMNLGVCFQVILRKDGTFKYQYKEFNEYSNISGAFGLAGTSNENGSDGVKLPERYITFGNAVEFSPLVEQTIAPGESKTVELVVNTDLMAGEYHGVFEIISNVPSKESIEIPINLNISGVAVPVFPDDIVVENIMGASDEKYHGPITAMGAFYEAYFKIENAGKATFTIDEIINDNVFHLYDSFFDEEYEQPVDLFMYVDEKDWFGDPTGNKAWTSFYPDNFEPIIVDDKGLELSIPIMGTIEYTPGTYECPITIKYTANGEQDEATINVTFIVTQAPSIFLDSEEIRVENVSDEYHETHEVVISNMGDYKLTYEIRIDPTGKGEVVEEGDGGDIPDIGPLSKDQLSGISVPMATHASSTNPLDAPQDFEYRNALFHPAMPGVNGTMTYGAGNKYTKFVAATLFEAPAEGFNISHIYLPTTFTNANDGSQITNGEIKVEIVNGEDYQNGEVLASGKVVYETMEGARFLIIPLTKAVYMSEGQTFYVRVTYPVGVEFPAYISYKEEAVVSNRYMGYVEGYGWFDMAMMFKEQYGSLGYIISCLETTEGDAWCKLLTTETTGELQPGESTNISLSLNAAFAPKELDNKAVLVIKSNDPNMPIINFPIYLSKNSSPIIIAPTAQIYAKEAESTSVHITVSDPETDAMSVYLSNAREDMVSIKSATLDGMSSATIQDGVVEVPEGTFSVDVEVEIAPEYQTAGSYSFTIKAVDANAHESSETVAYYVQHVNQAPTYISSIEEITIAVNATSDMFSLEDMFSDVDGDAITYEIAVANKNVVTMFKSGNDVLFMGKSQGVTTATITATDANGAKTVVTITINVVVPTGITDNTLANGGVIATLDGDELNIIANVDYTDAIVAMYDCAGRQVYLSECSVSNSHPSKHNVGNLSTGIYIVKVATPNASYATYVAKK